MFAGKGVTNGLLPTLDKIISTDRLLSQTGESATFPLRFSNIQTRKNTSIHIKLYPQVSTKI